MYSLLLVAKAAQDEDFRLRVRAAMFLTAADILARPVTTPDDARTKHAAASVTGAAEMLVWQFVWLCAVHPTIRETITEDDTTGAVVVGASDDLFLAACDAGWRIVAGLPT